MLDFCTIQVRSQADYPTVGAAADYCAASRQASTACAANRQASSASRQASTASPGIRLRAVSCGRGGGRAMAAALSRRRRPPAAVSAPDSGEAARRAAELGQVKKGKQSHSLLVSYRPLA